MLVENIHLYGVYLLVKQRFTAVMIPAGIALLALLTGYMVRGNKLDTAPQFSTVDPSLRVIRITRCPQWTCCRQVQVVKYFLWLERFPVLVYRHPPEVVPVPG
ncbi:MAG: hypothetical protein ACFFD4_12410 [Candidatus Odinarchaeota archaeon]